MISESQINKSNKNIVKLKQVKEYFNNILTTFLSNIKLNCNNINSLDYLDSNLKIFENEVNNIIYDLEKINKNKDKEIENKKVNKEIENKKVNKEIKFKHKWTKRDMIYAFYIWKKYNKKLPQNKTRWIMKQLKKDEINNISINSFKMTLSNFDYLNGIGNLSNTSKLQRKLFYELEMNKNEDIITLNPLNQKFIKLTSENSSNYIGYPILFVSRGELQFKKIKGTSNTGKTINIEHSDLNNSLEIVNRKAFVIIKKSTEQEHKVNENIITSIPSPTEQEHKVKFVDFNIKNSGNAKFTGIFNNERIKNNNKFNRFVIYWAYRYLYDKNFDRLNSNIKITMNKIQIINKSGTSYKNEYSDEYYVSNSSTKYIYKNIMNIKNIAESKNIKFNLENVYVEYKEQEHKVNENIITPILSPTEQEHIVEFENKDIYSGNDDIIFPRGFTKIQIINFMRKNGYKIATGYMSDQGQWYLRSRNKDIGYAINMGLRPDKCNKVGVVTIILINE